MGITTDAWGANRLSSGKRLYLKLCHAFPEGKITRRLVLWLRKPLKAMLPAYVDVEIWGLKLRLKSRGNLSEQRLILMPQFLDSIERKILTKELQSGGIFLDIGANAGVYSLWVAASCAKNVRVLAFEPDHSLCERLQWNLDTNSLGNVELHRIALGREEGAVTLLKSESNQGENRVSGAGQQGLTVPMQRLDVLLKNAGIDKATAMKIDVEGMEVEVLEPYFSTVPRESLPKIIICEVLDANAISELLSLLKEYGYEQRVSCRMNGVFYRADMPSN